MFGCIDFNSSSCLNCLNQPKMTTSVITHWFWSVNYWSDYALFLVLHENFVQNLFEAIKFYWSNNREISCEQHQAEEFSSHLQTDQCAVINSTNEGNDHFHFVFCDFMCLLVCEEIHINIQYAVNIDCYVSFFVLFLTKTKIIIITMKKIYGLREREKKRWLKEILWIGTSETAFHKRISVNLVLNAKQR